jgi:hypothetical protein
MIGEKFKYGAFPGLSRLLWTMPDICKVSDGTRVLVKCLKSILIPCIGAGCVWG